MVVQVSMAKISRQERTHDRPVLGNIPHYYTVLYAAHSYAFTVCDHSTAHLHDLDLEWTYMGTL